jgi:hypothetical protein
MMEDAVQFLSKDMIVQAITRSATKVCLILNLKLNLKLIHYPIYLALMP